MDVNKSINELLEKDISRKEFLQFVGGGIIVLFGLQNLINYLTQFNQSTSQSASPPARHGFGASKFGK
jgi:hypothetical protein